MIRWRRNGVQLPAWASGSHSGPKPCDMLDMSALLDNPSSPFSLLQGNKEMLDQIFSYTNIALLPCSYCKDQAVTCCCRNYKLIACIYPEELPKSLIKEVYGKGETILEWAVGVQTGRSCGGGSPQTSSSCAGPGPTTYMVVTTSGFYSEVLNFCWDDCVNHKNKFIGFLVGTTLMFSS
jgi:hypothetical protein